MVCVLKTSYGGTGMIEVSEGLSAGGWIRTADHSLCADCQLLGASVCTCPKECVWGWRSLVSWESTEVSPLHLDMSAGHAVGK